MNAVLKVFTDTDMRNQHRGLTEIARTRKVDLTTLGRAEHVLFINKACNRVKLFSCNNVLSYYIARDRKIDLTTIGMIYRCFGQNGEVDWVKAEKLALMKKLKLEADA